MVRYIAVRWPDSPDDLGGWCHGKKVRDGVPEQTSDEPDHDGKLGKVVAETGASKDWERGVCHCADIAIE
jgi:hypothetical protein